MHNITIRGPDHGSSNLDPTSSQHLITRTVQTRLALTKDKSQAHLKPATKEVAHQSLWARLQRMISQRLETRTTTTTRLPTVVDSKSQLLSPVRRTEIQTFSLSKSKLFCSARIPQCWTRRRSSSKTMSQLKPARRSAESSSPTLPTRTKGLSETTTKTEWASF